MAAVRISAVTTEGCDFNGVVSGLAIGGISKDGDEHNAELSAHGKRLRKDADDLMRRGGSGNVIVCGFAIKKQVTHTAADEIGGVSLFAQSKRDARGFNRFVGGQVHFFFTAEDAKRTGIWYLVLGI
jgi:hypothetical protein